MTRCFKTKKENTQELNKFLRSKSWFNDQFKIGHSGKYVLIPITDKVKQKDLANKFKELSKNEI